MLEDVFNFTVKILTNKGLGKVDEGLTMTETSKNNIDNTKTVKTLAPNKCFSSPFDLPIP